VGWGEAVTFVGALSFAAGVAWMGRLGADFDPLAIAAVQAWAIALLLVPAAPTALREFAALSPAGWGRFAYLAIAGSLIAPVLMLAAQRALPPGRVGLLLGLEPVFAVIFAATVGGERFLARWWLGAALILAAVVLVEWRALSSPRPATARSAA
jgi:drug/metabolite transporter (DMT)-like permease